MLIGYNLAVADMQRAMLIRHSAEQFCENWVVHWPHCSVAALLRSCTACILACTGWLYALTDWRTSVRILHIVRARWSHALTGHIIDWLCMHTDYMYRMHTHTDFFSDAGSGYTNWLRAGTEGEKPILDFFLNCFNKLHHRSCPYLIGASDLWVFVVFLYRSCRIMANGRRSLIRNIQIGHQRP